MRIHDDQIQKVCLVKLELHTFYQESKYSVAHNNFSREIAISLR